MADNRTFVIVGAGLAGAKAAETLRAEGFTGRVVLLGAEPDRPYERPPLSKGLLLGDAGRDSVFVHAADWYAAHDVDLRTATTVTAVDRSGRSVRLASGETLGYDRLLLATGAVPRALPVPGAGRALTLRTLADSRRIADAARPGARIVVIGAGWIGLEVAAAARTRGAAVTVVEAGPVPLQRVLGDRIGGVFADLHRAHGVTFRFGARIERVTGDGVVLAPGEGDGETLPADAVVAGVGVTPDVALAEAAGLRTGDGVLVDDRLRTSDPDIFAAGDIARVEHPLFKTGVRVEHWATALNTGPAAARAMLGRDVSYDDLPYFFTDQYDLGMEYSGWIPPDAAPEVVVRGDPAAREFLAFWLVGRRLVAGMSVNVGDVTETIQRLVRAGWQGSTVDPARLADGGVPLGDVTT